MHGKSYCAGNGNSEVRAAADSTSNTKCVNAYDASTRVRGPRSSFCSYSIAKHLAGPFIQADGPSLPSAVKLFRVKCKVDTFCEYAGAVC